MNKISSQDYCKNFVRENNYNLYLLHFFVPRVNRRNILALMALHTELRMIPKKVHDPMMRIIRLKWWEDEIEKIQNKKPYSDSPILQELALNTIEWEEYFIRLDQSLRGEDSDVDEYFYKIMFSTLPNQHSQKKFTKKLVLHDQLSDNTGFRAVRLWLGI